MRFERFNERGDRRIVRLAGKGDLIGQEALLQRPHSDDAIACTPRAAVPHPDRPGRTISKRGQNAAASASSTLRWLMALDDAEAWVAELASGSARQRVLRLLERLDSHADAAGHIWLPRREDIGAMLDMTFETASRQISQLRREGVLSSGAGRAATIDRKALMAALAAERLGWPRDSARGYISPQAP